MSWSKIFILLIGILIFFVLNAFTVVLYIIKYDYLHRLCSTCATYLPCTYSYDELNFFPRYQDAQLQIRFRFWIFILIVNRHIQSCQITYFVVYIVFIFVYILCIYVLHCSYALLLKLSMGVITIITRPVNKSKSMVTDMLYWPQQYDRSPTQASYIWILTCYYYH